MFEAGYFVDPDENAVVFVIGTNPAVKITNKTLTVAASATLQMTATTLPPDATVTWSTDASTYGTINSSTGVLTGVTAGTVAVTASITHNGVTVTDTVNVTVSAAKGDTKKS